MRPYLELTLNSLFKKEHGRFVRIPTHEEVPSPEYEKSYLRLMRTQAFERLQSRGQLVGAFRVDDTFVGFRYAKDRALKLFIVPGPIFGNLRVSVDSYEPQRHTCDLIVNYPYNTFDYWKHGSPPLYFRVRLFWPRVTYLGLPDALD